MATLRSNFSQSDEELREILNLDDDLAAVPIEGTLRAMVNGLKDSREDFRILEEGDGWIRNLEALMVDAQDPLLRRELHKSADLVRIVRILAEFALLELAEEGVSDEDRRTGIESPEERRLREEERRETILRLINETIDAESAGGEALSLDALEYGIAARGNLEHILPVDRSAVLSGASLKAALDKGQGDLLVARPSGSDDFWEALSKERMGEIVEAVEACCDAPSAPASETMENISVELEYGIACYGDLSDIIFEQSKSGRLSSRDWAEGSIQPEYGDLLVARQAARPGAWSIVSSTGTERSTDSEVLRATVDLAAGTQHSEAEASSPEPFSYGLPELDLEEETEWMAEVDQWIEEIGQELNSVSCETKRGELKRRAALLNALSESAWKYNDLNH